MRPRRVSEHDRLAADLEKAWLAIIVGGLGLGLSVVAFALGYLWFGCGS